MKKQYIILLLVLFGSLIYVEYNIPKPVDWTPHFGMNSKKPYGCYALYKLLHKAFPSGKIMDNHESFYVQTKNKLRLSKKSILLITSQFNPDKLDIDALLSQVKEGNDAFISALFFSKQFLDTLKLEHMYDWNSYIPILNESVKGNIYFTNPKLKRWKRYAVEKQYLNYYFSAFDTLNTTVLGKSESNNVNFICINYGKGKIFINTIPYVFTNYNLLFENYEYAFKALSHLTDGDIIWDEYYKPFKSVIKTPLRYILSQPSLKAAYILLICTLIIYLIFEAKRKQRIIPVIQPPKNTSLEFAETVARLYLNNADHQDLILKKFNYFSELLRSRFYFSTIEFTEKFYAELAEKSGVDYKLIEKIFLLTAHYKAHATVSEESLIRYNSMINEFWEKTK